MIPAGVEPERLEAIIKKAGTIILSYVHKQLFYTEKDQNGFVTEADLASEQFLIKELGALLPQACVIAEESGETGLVNDYCWVIDPLDGTTNFAHHIPYYCISVALTYQQKPVLGIVYNPLIDEYFYAQKGMGAYLNGVKMGVSHEKNVAKSMVVVGFPYAKNEQFMDLVHKVQQILPESYALRYFGAAALDLAHVAAGRVDAAFFEGLKWWDMAAGILLVEEAGGIATDFQGKGVDPLCRSIVAANRPMHEKLLPWLR